MKICTKCDTPKPLEEFHKDKNNPSGFRSCCKLCFKENYQDKSIQKIYYRKWFNNHYEQRVEKKVY